MLGSPWVKRRYLGSEPDSSDGVHQVLGVFIIYGGGLRARSTKGPQIWDADPGWGGRGFPKCEGVQDFV